MDPFLVQRVWAGAESAAAAITQPAAADDPFSPFSDSKVAAAAAGYFPLPPPHHHHHHHRGLPFPFALLPGGGGMAEEDVRFELLMTGVASLVVVGMWVGGLVLWYFYCIRRPPRLFCGACFSCPWGCWGLWVDVCLSVPVLNQLRHNPLTTSTNSPPKYQKQKLTGKGKLIQEVVAACPSLQRPYCPPVWCLSPWAQVKI